MSTNVQPLVVQLANLNGTLTKILQVLCPHTKVDKEFCIKCREKVDTNGSTAA